MKYTVQLTKDNSFTLVDKLQEPMHHSKGAFSERLFIYSDAVNYSLNNFSSFKFLSVGLGLGYNEFLIVAQCLKNNWAAKDFLNRIFYLESYEKDLILTKNLLDYLYGKPSVWEEAYSSILSQIATHYKIDISHFKKTLKQLHKKKIWIIKKALPNISTDCASEKIFFNCILYDAYCSKINPELWSFKYLDYFLQNFSDTKACIFRSYASLTLLKKALKKNKFTLIKTAGFDYKRESTKAVKNFNPN